MHTTQLICGYDAPAVAKLLGSSEVVDPPTTPPGFITFFDPGWSILTLLHRLHAKKVFSPQSWYEHEPFAKREEPSSHRQLRMEAVHDSLGKTFAEQKALIPPDEEIPTARVAMMGTVIHFLATGQRLFPACYVRCVDRASDGNRVFVGYFGSDVFVVDRCWDDRRHNGLGLASSRKFT